jgi:hypothetical protein
VLAALVIRGRAQSGPRSRGWLRAGLLAPLTLLGCWSGWTGAATASPEKVVRYRGYRVVVPASWPVYHLRSDPSACVRFDRHAVYLGEPGSAQRCPAHAVGRTEAILVEPLTARSSRTPDSAGSALSPVGEREAQPPQGSSAQVVVPRAGVIVTATWGKDPRPVERALGTPLAGSSTAGEAMHAASRPPPRARAASAAAGGVYTGLGFDPCSTPSTAQMAAWSESPYRAVGIYLGGVNMACAQPSLTASWVGTETAAGWRLIPTYVGLQAPSNSCGCSGINPRRASAEGAAAARDAVNRAGALGIGPGSPIYYDMEAYGRGGSNTPAVLAFLAAWTSSLHAAGYKSGVYSNADSGISDLVAARGTRYAEPDDIWMADWNGERGTASPYVPSGEWGDHERLHQFSGGHNETYGGVRINIDGDFLDGATAGASTADAAAFLPDGTFVQVTGSPATYKIAGGAPLLVSPRYWQTLGAQPLTTISEQQFALLNPVPAEGTFLEDSTGAFYRVAGGAPMLVSEPSLFGGAQPVTVDHWDLANISRPAAHLNSVPANGTFLTTTSGSVYRVAGGAPFAITSWSLFGGVRPSVTVDQWDLSNLSSPAAHLDSKPLDATVVEGLPSRSYWMFSRGTRRLTSANAAAVQVDDVGLAAFPAPPCVVPRLHQMTLHRAKRALRRADCRLAELKRPGAAGRSRTLRVISQIPPPRTSHPAGYAVSVGLG